MSLYKGNLSICASIIIVVICTLSLSLSLGGSTVNICSLVFLTPLVYNWIYGKEHNKSNYLKKIIKKKIKNFVCSKISAVNHTWTVDHMHFKLLHNVFGMILLGMYHLCHIWVQTKRFMKKNLKMGMPGHVSVQTRKIQNTKILVHPNDNWIITLSWKFQTDTSNQSICIHRRTFFCLFWEKCIWS